MRVPEEGKFWRALIKVHISKLRLTSGSRFGGLCAVAFRALVPTFLTAVAMIGTPTSTSGSDASERQRDWHFLRKSLHQVCMDFCDGKLLSRHNFELMHF